MITKLINPGELKEKLLIQKRDIHNNEEGYTQEVFTTIYNTRGTFEIETSRDMIYNEAEYARQRVNFVTRRKKNLDSSLFVLHNNIRYNILTISPIGDNYVKLYCQSFLQGEGI